MVGLPRHKTNLPRLLQAGGGHATNGMAAKIDSMVGMVERGLFLKMANLALIAGENEIVERTV